MNNAYKVPEFVKQHRKIKPTRRSVSGVYPFRGDEPVEYESTLERDFLIQTPLYFNEPADLTEKQSTVAKSQRGSFVKNTDRTNGMLIFRCALNEAWSSA